MVDNLSNSLKVIKRISKSLFSKVVQAPYSSTIFSFLSFRIFVGWCPATFQIHCMQCIQVIHTCRLISNMATSTQSIVSQLGMFSLKICMKSGLVTNNFLCMTLKRLLHYIVNKIEVLHYSQAKG